MTKNSNCDCIHYKFKTSEHPLKGIPYEIQPTDVPDSITSHLCSLMGDSLACVHIDNQKKCQHYKY